MDGNTLISLFSRIISSKSIKYVGFYKAGNEFQQVLKLPSVLIELEKQDADNISNKSFVSELLFSLHLFTYDYKKNSSVTNDLTEIVESIELARELIYTLCISDVGGFTVEYRGRDFDTEEDGLYVQKISFAMPGYVEDVSAEFEKIDVKEIILNTCKNM